MVDPEQPDLTALTVQLLSAYVANNSVPSEDLAGLIEATRTALSGKPQDGSEPEASYVPAVSVRKSLGSRDHLISMIDGKPYKTLKRHLAGHGLTPAEYRSRYNLAADYPMVAPGYSETRREVAKRLGLGRKPTVISGDEAVETDDVPDELPGTTSQPTVATGEATKSVKEQAARKPARTARPNPAAAETPASAEAAPESQTTSESAAAGPAAPRKRKPRAKASSDKVPKAPKVARKPRTPKTSIDAAPSETTEVKVPRRRGPGKKAKAAVQSEETAPAAE
jgi:predicted transcriptional regulator